jgi:soluble lytic murein transglycosylase
VRLGMRQLLYLHHRFPGRWDHVLAAYNAGAAAVTRWLGRDAPQSEAAFIESIPYVQTRHYVAAVLRNAWMYGRLY